LNLRAVFYLISYLLMVLGLGMASCWGISMYYHDPASAQYGLAIPGILTLTIALILSVATRTKSPIDLSRRDGFGIVTFGWLFAALFGAAPFVWSGIIPNPIGAVFETMSGFTTTGASVMWGLDQAPKGLLLWRALTHFFGGMGVLVLCVAILPFLGVGGMQIFRAEMPGPSKDRLTPRIANTAKLLWGIYVALCLVEIVLLKIGGMSGFDAVCHSFATVATGGFSTRDASLGFYNSVYIEVVVTVFMFLAGINFSLHYRALRGNLQAFWKDSEFLVYLIIWALACTVMTLNLWHHTAPTLPSAIRAAFFTGTSVMTTTGFATADFDLWPAFSKLVLIVLMFVGGCAGSTSGGLKIIRIHILLKIALREIRLFLQPQAIVQVKVGKKPVEAGIVSGIAGFFVIYLLTFVAASALMCLFMPDLISAFTSVAATLGNIGPGLASVGPMLNYSQIPDAGLIVLTLCMLLGRLELYTALVILLPHFWKK